ncbi:SH3 beta-barrel fold-containing protein [bacterium]|jgi:hypothetical protein|nr:SH3 beta-barrel fold-containing protein [bacterium]
MSVDVTNIQQRLEQNVLTVDFIKVNGDKRTMNCTLRTDIIPTPAATNSEVNRNREPNKNIQVVWDTDAAGWRSFRCDSIVEISIVEEYKAEWYNNG